MLSTAMSVASFSIVLGETFACVGLSTLVPNTFVAMARAAHKVSGEKTTSDTLSIALLQMVDNAKSGDPKSLPNNPLNAATGILKEMAHEMDSVDLLVPKTATIDAEFEFYGAETYSGEAEVGAQIQLVTVKAGFSALYESHSSNKVKLHVDFATVAYNL